MNTLLWPFFIILFASLFFAELFKKFKMPWVIALIIAGIIIGPQALEIIEVNETTNFFSEIGLIFVMFMAGLETNLFHKSRENYFRKIGFIALVNGLFPFVVGLLIGLFFGYSIIASLLIGVIFISSSIAVVIPSLESAGILRSDVGRTIVAATIIQDVASLLLLSFLLQVVDYSGGVPHFILYPALIVLFYVFRKVIPAVRNHFAEKFQKEVDVFEQELRSVLVLLIGTVIVFTFLGLHPIVSAFFAGIVLADTISNKSLKKQLHSIGYGIFIPIFFVIVGARTDISVFFDPSSKVIYLILAVVLSSISAKFISGYFAARKLKYNDRESKLIGVSTMPQLSTTLAVALTGVEFNLIDSALVTTLVTLSIVSTFLAPVFINLLSKKYITTYLLEHRARSIQAKESEDIENKKKTS